MLMPLKTQREKQKTSSHTLTCVFDRKNRRSVEKCRLKSPRKREKKKKKKEKKKIEKARNLIAKLEERERKK